MTRKFDARQMKEKISSIRLLQKLVSQDESNRRYLLYGRPQSVHTLTMYWERTVHTLHIHWRTVTSPVPWESDVCYVSQTNACSTEFNNILVHFRKQIFVIAGSLLFTVKRVQNLKIIALRPRVNDESFKVVLTSESVKGIKINVTIQVHLLPITLTRWLT